MRTKFTYYKNRQPARVWPARAYSADDGSKYYEELTDTMGRRAGLITKRWISLAKHVLYHKNHVERWLQKATSPSCGQYGLIYFSASACTSLIYMEDK